MNQVDAAWVAGLLEGEGSFLAQTGGVSPRITCQMTDHDVLLKLQSLCGGSVYEVTKRQAHWKDCWIWRLGGDAAEEVMEEILPFMGSRRSKKIVEVLEAYAVHKERKAEKSSLLDSVAQEYLDGAGSLRELGDKNCLGYETIRRRAKVLQSS